MNVLMRLVRMVALAIFLGLMAGLAAGDTHPILDESPNGRPDRALDEDQPKVQPRRPALAGSFSGEWYVVNGDLPYFLKLEQELDRVTGTFDRADGPVSGTIRHGVLLLTWKEGGQECSAVLELFRDEEDGEVYLAADWEGPKEYGTWYFVGPQR